MRKPWISLWRARENSLTCHKLPLQTQQVALDNIVVLTSKPRHQTPFVPHSTDNRSIYYRNDAIKLNVQNLSGTTSR